MCVLFSRVMLNHLTLHESLGLGLELTTSFVYITECWGCIFTPVDQKWLQKRKEG